MSSFLRANLQSGYSTAVFLLFKRLSKARGSNWLSFNGLSNASCDVARNYFAINLASSIFSSERAHAKIFRPDFDT